MKTRIFLAASLLLVMTFLLVSPALAGGWAVITLDELPGEMVAGQPLEVGFMVRQHGATPIEGLEPTIHYPCRLPCLSLSDPQHNALLEERVPYLSGRQST